VLTNRFKTKELTIYPHCIYVFCIYLRTNSELCHLQHKLIGFYNRDEKCLQRGRTESLNKAVCTSSLKPFGYLMHQQFNIQQLYALPTLCLRVFYLSE